MARQAGSGSDDELDKPVADDWFGAEAQNHDIVRFREIHVDPYAVGDFWLLRGSDRDLVVDSGSGIVPCAPMIRSIAGPSLLAVALNSYYDHAGGWHGFAERACHRLDAPALKDLARANAGYGVYLKDSSLRALPHPGYRLADYRMTGAEATQTLADGDRIDLGDRSLDVLHLPGRSPGGIALWEAATGSLFTSDMLYDGDHGPAWPPDDPAAYCASLRRIGALPVSRVYPGHYGPFGRARMMALIDAQTADLEARS